MMHQESVFQRNCVAWFRLQYPALATMLFAVPNGGGRSRVEAAIMKGEGVTAGVADLLLLVPRGGFASLCIELKTQTGRQAPSQKAWQKAAENAGNRYVVCRSFEDFQAQVRAYLAQPDARQLQVAGRVLVDKVEAYLRQGCHRAELIVSKEDFKRLLK